VGADTSLGWAIRSFAAFGAHRNPLLPPSGPAARRVVVIRAEQCEGNACPRPRSTRAADPRAADQLFRGGRHRDAPIKACRSRPCRYLARY